MTKNRISIGNGMISIFLIFICLTLTCFSVLAFLSANVDKKYTDKRVKETTLYYEADAKARKILWSIDDVVTKEKKNGCPNELIIGAIEEIDSVKADMLGESILAEYNVPIDDNKNILVKLEINKDGKFKITQWKTNVNMGEITDEPLNLWDGN